MCGILAVINNNGSDIDSSLVHRMRDTLVHRGPDDQGMLIHKNIALGHRRLSIIDLSESGRQPMSNEDDSVFVVFNGEIYNYLELIPHLKNRGHHFTSTSDTEVILHQYEEDGLDFLDKLNGMFSFVVWDKKNNTVIAARDRLGIKPLYFYTDTNKTIFASEIKAIIEDPTVPRKANNQAILDYYFAGIALNGKTVFDNIHEVPPGNCVIIDLHTNTLKIKEYWDVEFNYNHTRSDDQVNEEMLALLDNSVEVHCRSDAPLGCHLSGGLDTSTVVALAARHREQLKTFSIKFSDEPYIDETEYAIAVNDHVGATYCEGSPTAEDFAQLIPSLAWHMDTPMATVGGITYYTVSKLAQSHVKVSLTGHGGDELFAGYPIQFQAAFNRTDMFTRPAKKDPYRDMKIPLSEKLKMLSYQRIASIITRKLRNRFVKKETTLESLWIERHCRSLADDKIFTSNFKNSLDGYSPEEDYLRPLNKAKTDKVLDKVLYHDQRVYLPSLLHLEDRASMAVSIESRVPFLDYRILEYLATIPPEQKVRGMQPKYLMRQAASKLLPEKVWKRSDKRAFPVPRKFWMTQQLKGLVEDILLDQSSLERGIFKPKTLKYACRNDIGMAWAFVNVELWHKIFIDQNRVWLDKVKAVQL